MILICRRDSFITHRAFCDILAQEAAKSQPSKIGDDDDDDGDAMKAEVDEAVPLLDPPPVSSSPLPPNTPTTGVLSPVLSIQSSGKLSYKSLFYVVHIVHVKGYLFCLVQFSSVARFILLLGFVY